MRFSQITKRYLALTLGSLLLLSCKSQENMPATDKKAALQQIMDTDRSWNKRSLETGYNKSRIEFAADEAIVLLDGEMPLRGISAVEAYAATHPDTSFTFQWAPLRGEVAASGDLGYTFGGWTLNTKTAAGKDTASYGDYMTVWKKQPDGSWKFVIDSGTNTPQPVEG